MLNECLCNVNEMVNVVLSLFFFHVFANASENARVSEFCSMGNSLCWVMVCFSFAC